MSCGEEGADVMETSLVSCPQEEAGAQLWSSRKPPPAAFLWPGRAPCVPPGDCLEGTACEGRKEGCVWSPGLREERPIPNRKRKKTGTGPHPAPPPKPCGTSDDL